MVDTRWRFFWMAFQLFTALLLGGSVRVAQEQITITLTSLQVGVGETDTVEARIDGMAGQTGAFAVTLQFDPRIIHVESAEIGGHLGSTIFLVENTIDTDTGLVRLAAAALGKDFSAQERVLLRLYISGVEAGESMLHVVESELGDLNGNRLEHVWIDGAVIVSDMSIGPSEPTPTDSDMPCTIQADRRGVPVRVGAGFQRGIRGSLSVGDNIPVVGQVTDSTDNLWWQVHPPGFDQAEADRYWVLADDVLARGDCHQVPATMTSPLVLAIPPRQATTPATGSAPGAGSWGACGSCATCGYRENECLLSPTGECLWDPATCSFDRGPWWRGMACSAVVAEFEPYYTQLRQTVPPIPAKYDLNGDGFLDIMDVAIALSQCS